MNRPRPTDRIDTARVIAVGASAMMGAGILYGPGRISLTVGALAPVAYALAGIGTMGLAVGFVVLASGPLGEAYGGPYLHFSRILRSRFAGLLLSAPVPLAYIALLAAVAHWLARAAPLPTAASGIIARVGTSGSPGVRPSVLEGPLSVITTSVSELAAMVILSAALGVHLLGARRTADTGLVLTGSVVVVGVGVLFGGFLPGVDGVLANNFAPPDSTFAFQNAVTRLPTAVVIALFSFIGFEASATAVDVPSDPDTRVPAGLVGLISGATCLFALAAATTLGVLGPTRLRFAAVPVADAVAAYLPLVNGLATRVVPVVLGLGSVLGLGWPASRTLAGIGELVTGPESCSPQRTPLVPLVVVYGSAVAVTLVDGVVTLVSAAVGGLVLVYLAHALTTAALPFLRPEVYDRCRYAPPTRLLVAMSGAGVLTAAGLLRLVLLRSPATTLSYTNHGPVVVALGLAPFAPPVGRIIPPLVGVELLAVIGFLIARDLREGRGIELPPVDSCYPLSQDPAVPSEPTGTEKHDRTDRQSEHGGNQPDGDGDYPD